MNYERTKEHKMIGKAVREFISKELTPIVPELDEEEQPVRSLNAMTVLPGGRKPSMDRNAICNALERCGGRRQEAADLLGISRTSMWRHMKRQGLV